MPQCIYLVLINCSVDQTRKSNVFVSTYLFVLMCLVLVSVYMCGFIHVIAHLCRSEDNLWKLVLSLSFSLLYGSQVSTLVFRLEGQFQDICLDITNEFFSIAKKATY